MYECVYDARATERVSFDLVVWLRGWLICIYGYMDMVLMYFFCGVAK